LEKIDLDKQGFAYSYHFEHHYARNYKLLHVEFEGLDNSTDWQEIDICCAGHNASELPVVWCFEQDCPVVELAPARF